MGPTWMYYGGGDTQDGVAHIFLQWKGTEACMDIWCECGSGMHLDAGLVYQLKCMDCGALYLLPSSLPLQKITEPVAGLAVPVEFKDAGD